MKFKIVFANLKKNCIITNIKGKKTFEPTIYIFTTIQFYTRIY